MTNGDEDENGNGGGGEHDLALIQAASYGIGVASRCCSSSSNSKLDHNTTSSLNDYVMECVYGLGEAIQFICKILILF